MCFGIIIAYFGEDNGKRVGTNWFYSLGCFNDISWFEEDILLRYAILNLSMLQLDNYKKNNLI